MSPPVKTKRVSAKDVPSVIVDGELTPDAGDRLQWIATAAYFLAERRGFVPGLDVEDWLNAENEYDARREEGA